MTKYKKLILSTSSILGGMRGRLSFLALLPLVAIAQTVPSPNGNVKIKFSLSDSGQPTY